MFPWRSEAKNHRYFFYWLSFHFSRGQNTENPVPRSSLLPNPTETLATQAKPSHIASLFTQESLQPIWRGYIVTRLDS